MEIVEVKDDSDTTSPDFLIRQRKLPDVPINILSPTIRDWVSKNIMLRAALKPTGDKAEPPEVMVPTSSDVFSEREPIETYEPRMFKGMCFQDFNDYLYKNGRVANVDHDSLLQRLRERGDGSRTPGTPAAGASPRSPSSPGLEVVREDGVTDLSIFEIAQKLIGQVRHCREFTSPQHFMLTVIDETDTLLKRMLGKLESIPWKAFEASVGMGKKIQFIADLYLDTFKFLPRHCYMTCEEGQDPIGCCWEQKFGNLILETDNALRLVRLTNMLRIELTRAICIFLRDNEFTAVDFPDHVHLVMEEWIASAFDDEIAQLPPRRGYEHDDNCSLGEKTGLTIDELITYKRRYRDKKYSFETRSDEHRIETESKDDPLGWRRTSGQTKYAVIVPYIKKYPHMLFKDFTQQFQMLLWWKVGMFSSNIYAEDKRMHMWYNRVRRAEVQRLERIRAGFPP